jgi:hypothetical protein
MSHITGKTDTNLVTATIRQKEIPAAIALFDEASTLQHSRLT